MKLTRSIRRMTPEETAAKRDWGTSGCQVDGCDVEAAYLVMENGPDQEWWEYRCARHARDFAARHKLPMPKALHSRRRAS